MRCCVCGCEPQDIVADYSTGRLFCRPCFDAAWDRVRDSEHPDRVPDLSTWVEAARPGPAPIAPDTDLRAGSLSPK